MAASPKPTIVLIPGAWHSPSHYTTLHSHLQTAGYPTTSSRLPSVGSTDPLAATTAQDASFIREQMLLPLLNQGKDILLVLHSYGGLPGSAAAKGLSKSERAKDGKKCGITGLVLIAALVAREGDSLQLMVGGKLHDWVETDVRPLRFYLIHPPPPPAPHLTISSNPADRFHRKSAAQAQSRTPLQFSMATSLRLSLRLRVLDCSLMRSFLLEHRVRPRRGRTLSMMASAPISAARLTIASLPSRKRPWSSTAAWDGTCGG
jgi:hypothetical protein